MRSRNVLSKEISSLGLGLHAELGLGVSLGEAYVSIVFVKTVAWTQIDRCVFDFAETKPNEVRPGGTGPVAGPTFELGRIFF